MRYLIANWKSHHTVTQTMIWLEDIAKRQLSIDPETKVIICLPYTDIAEFNRQAALFGLPFHAGAQNVSPFPEGRHTGEISSYMLSELVSYCLVGHSERRLEFKETSDVVAAKTKLLLEYSITPIICVDQPYIDEQLKELFKLEIDISKCLFVYEPLAAIGTGKPADPISVNHVASNISFLAQGSCPILYGGSVNPQNVREFTTQSNISGVLVGQDSLDPNTFGELINLVS